MSTGQVLQPVVSRIWSITINNPMPVMDDPVFIDGELASQPALYYNYSELDMLQSDELVEEIHAQYERGSENNTLHIQCCAMFILPVNFNYIKSILPKAHIERGRSWSALKRYCSKEDTRIHEEPPYFYIQVNKVIYVNDVPEGVYIYPEEYQCENSCYIPWDHSPEDALVMMSNHTCKAGNLFRYYFKQKPQLN